jgi:hypothetical protein
MGEYLLEYESGPEGKLARLGVDGIIVAKETAFAPRPETEWELAVTMDEGRVFHRRGMPLPRVRSVTTIDSRPGEHFVAAQISRIVNVRNSMQADVAVPAGADPALLAISRPFFNGYQARLDGRRLEVDSYRGMFPIIELPAGTHGRLTLAYRPAWLVWGGAIAGLSLLVMIAGAIIALVAPQRRGEAVS